jgi:outer membrane receptor protein involved in Fe transport
MCEDPAVPGTALAASTCTGTPGWSILNLRAGYRWDAQFAALRALRIDVDAGNLIDVRYRVHGSGIDSAGRGIAATLAGEW